jgi:hypothetical protein
MAKLLTPSCSVSMCLGVVKIFAKATPGHSYGCARDNFPGVNSRVSGSKDWVDATICELSSSHLASCGDRLTATLETLDTPG